jgi:hypothetical protein
MSRLGRKFEEAVLAFAKTLDPSAEVLFDHKVPDRDTGTLRQCDVWINAKFGGHWPLSILVSCKDRKESQRKLDIGHIEKFCNEIRSTGATMGVIYSNVGFTEPALKKAKANDIACCRLYQNEPADIPDSIWFEHFASNTDVKLILDTNLRGSGLETWNDLFDIEIESDDGSTTILDVISTAFANGEDRTILKAKEIGSFPPDWKTDLAFKVDEIEGELHIQVLGRWKQYRARLEATLLNGSYCLSDNSFKGSQRGPWIDVKSAHPGESWTEITDRNFDPPSNRIIAILSRGDVKTALREGYGPKALY